jgi:transcriptional regulator with XRE-family HTH domain
MTLTMSKTASLIRDIRKTGLSQTEISKQTGIPQPRLSRWENGAVPAGADDAIKILAFSLKLGIESKSNKLFRGA